MSRVSTRHVPTLMDWVSWTESLLHGKTEIVCRHNALFSIKLLILCWRKKFALLYVSFYKLEICHVFTGVAPHCLDPGTVSSVTVEDFCGQNWEESMQKHQTIRSMSKPTTDTWFIVSMGQLSPKTKLYTPASRGSFNDILTTPWINLKVLWLLSISF